MAIYFPPRRRPARASARSRPRKLKAQMEEMDSLSEGVPAFFDLRRPWLYAPGG